MEWNSYTISGTSNRGWDNSECTPPNHISRCDTFQGSQKNWNVLTKEAYEIYMSFCKIVFYLKDAHVKIRCDLAPLCKFVIQWQRIMVNNWLQEIYAITPYIDFEHIKRRQCLGRQHFKTEDFTLI